MATIKFSIQSEKDNANIYVRYSINRNLIWKRKTGFVINPKDWSKDKGQPIQKSDDLKALKSKLDKLSVSINDAYNVAVSKGIELTGEWLQLQIDIFNNKFIPIKLDVLTNYIQKYIDDAPYRRKKNKTIGLSQGRIKNIKLFKSTISRYEAEKFKGKSILIKNVDLKFVENFESWLFAQKFSINYVGKNLSNLKTICNEAHKNDITTSTQLKNIKSISENRPPEQVIYLSEEEQETIKDTTLTREALINARNWLLLGCLIGQRGTDLLNITANNIKQLNGIKIIELEQQKTKKLVAIPLLPNALEIIESGLPYKISLTKFNEYIKEVCKIAKIDTPTVGRIRTTSKGATTKVTTEKHKLISSHICRRSFATNFYGRIPTPVLMNITAHGTEQIFLRYIGKTSYDNAYQMLDYFSKLAPKAKPPVMEVIRNTGTK